MERRSKSEIIEEVRKVGIIPREHIRAAEIAGEIVCKDCLTDEEWDEIKESQILGGEPMGSDEMVFCDRCKKEI